MCEALCAGRDVPTWVRDALPQLPEIMAESDRKAGALERASTDAVEAAVVSGRVGEAFPAVVVDLRDHGGGLVQLADPAVLAPVSGPVELGAAITVRLAEADVASRTVRFEPA